MRFSIHLPFVISRESFTTVLCVFFMFCLARSLAELCIFSVYIYFMRWSKYDTAVNIFLSEHTALLNTHVFCVSACMCVVDEIKNELKQFEIRKEQHDGKSGWAERVSDNSMRKRNQIMTTQIFVFENNIWQSIFRPMQFLATLFYSYLQPLAMYWALTLNHSISHRVKSWGVPLLFQTHHQCLCVDHRLSDRYARWVDNIVSATNSKWA